MADNLPKKILVVDSDQGACNSVTRLLQPYQITILAATDWGSALYQFNQNRFDLCIVALKMEGLPGSALVQKWRHHDQAEKRQTAFIIATSNQCTPADSALLVELGDVINIAKPYKLPPLLSAMSQAMTTKANRIMMEKIEHEMIEPLLKQQNYDQAMLIAKNKLEPLNEQGFYSSAMIHEKAKKYDSALSMLGQLATEHPNNMRYLGDIGRINLQLGHLAEAKKAYEKADSIAPLNIKRVKELAYMYLQTHEPDNSIAKFKELIDLTPEMPDMKYEAYTAIYEAGFAKHAQEFCRQTSTAKDLVRYFNNRGVLLAKDENYDGAIIEYQKAANLIPGNKELYRILFNMAISYINKKSQENLEKAKDLLEESLKLSPEYDKAKEKLDLVLKHLKKT